MASTLENYVSNVRTLSASGNFVELAEHLNETIEILSKNFSVLDNALDSLNMQQHSLGVLYILIAKFSNISSSTLEVPQLLHLFKNFIHLCNGEQVRFATPAYFHLCHLFANYIVHQPNCVQGIKIIANAIDKIRLFDTQLTAVHADLCLLSLKAKFFKIALSYLDVDVSSISIASDSRNPNFLSDGNNDARYFLLYYYYGGMIYAATKNYEKSLYFFEVCISTPAMTMSHIMLEAYKKFILVSLILHGKILPMPKYSSQTISRFIKPLTQIYHDLANTYISASNEDLRLVVNKFSETFQRDKNIGLVKQVLISLYKKNIQRLTKTFLTLSLTDVASRTQLSSATEAEKYVLNMVKSGEIYANIHQKDGMIVFKDVPEKYDSAEMFIDIEEDMSNVIELVKKINVMEEEIILNPLYNKKAIGNQQDELASQHVKSLSSDPAD